MRTFIAFVALCIVASSARTVYDKYRYQSGSSLGGSLGSRGGSYMRSSRMGGSYLDGNMYSTDSPYKTQYRGYSGNLYNNNYDDNFGLGTRMNYQDSSYPYSRMSPYSSMSSYNDNNRYNMYDYNRNGMYDYNSNNMYDYNSNYNPYRGRSGFSNYYDNNDDIYNYRNYDSVSDGYALQGGASLL
ncbi:uncharacterized protein LOC111116209 [Crassostrea virginica]